MCQPFLHQPHEPRLQQANHVRTTKLRHCKPQSRFRDVTRNLHCEESPGRHSESEKRASSPDLSARPSCRSSCVDAPTAGAPSEHGSRCVPHVASHRRVATGVEWRAGVTWTKRSDGVNAVDKKRSRKSAPRTPLAITSGGAPSTPSAGPGSQQSEVPRSCPWWTPST